MSFGPHELKKRIITLNLFYVQLVQLRREVNVRFVDIGRIYDHHNLIKI